VGALSFAVDTITSLSAVFAQKHGPVSYTNLTHLKLELDDNARRIFKEFSTGMQMLYKHGIRNPCNISAITNENLKLLYVNLKSNSSFKKAVIRINQNAGGNPNWAWLPLHSDTRLVAGIIYLPENASLSPDLKNTNQTSWHRVPGSPLPDCQSPKQHFVSLSGNSLMEFTGASRLRDRLLKSGDVFAEPYNNSPIVNRFSSRNGNSLILNIQLSSAV